MLAWQAANLSSIGRHGKVASMFWLLKVVIIMEFSLGLAFALVLLLDWLSGKIEMYISKEKKDRP